MKIKVKAQNSCYKDAVRGVRIFYLDIIPCITFRRVKWKFSCEYDLYLSWLAWCVEIAIKRDKPIILAK